MAANGTTKVKSETEEDGERTEAYAKLLENGILPKVATELDEIYKTGLLTHENLDSRALAALKECPEEKGLTVLKQFRDSDLEHVKNKSAYLCGVMKTYGMKALNSGTKERKGPDEAKLKEILDRTGYKLDITTGQRKYGPPPGCEEEDTPGAGHEVFGGKIPRELFEDELIPLFEKCGKIWDLRLMLDHTSGLNRGFCFVTYCDKDGAQEAVKQLDNYEIKKGHTIKVNLSVANTRLYIGNIPKDKDRDEIIEEFTNSVGLGGLVDAIIYAPSDDKKKNRGFTFLDFDSHKNASDAKKKLSYNRKVWKCDITVDWADTQEEPDTETMDQVRVLYLKNLSSDVTEETLKETFLKFGKVERVKKLKDVGFIHYEEREDAIKAMEELNGTVIGANAVAIALAKPQGKAAQRRKKMRMMMMNSRGRYGWYEYYDDYCYYPPPPPPMRGGRGGPRGMGRGRGGMFRGRPFRGGAPMMRPWGGKRKFGGDHNQSGGKRGNWGAHPIPQQPLRGGYNSFYSGGGGDDQWYQDTYGDNW